MTENGSAADRYDVVIIGAGPAGLTAGMYTSRQGLKPAIVAGEVGGQTLWAGEIENYPGWRLVTGKELIASFRDHVSQFGVECFEGRLVNAIVPVDDGYEVYTREGSTLPTRAIIIATGKAPNRLAVPGEQEFVGRGVSYCATCDAATPNPKRRNLDWPRWPTNAIRRIRLKSLAQRQSRPARTADGGHR
jgi:thioredoxin reductase